MYLSRKLKLKYHISTFTSNFFKHQVFFYNIGRILPKTMKRSVFRTLYSRCIEGSIIFRLNVNPAEIQTAEIECSVAINRKTILLAAFNIFFCQNWFSVLIKIVCYKYYYNEQIHILQISNFSLNNIY